MEKPTVVFSGHDGNVFALLGLCTRALKENNQEELAKELTKKVFGSESYDEALCIMMDYVEVE